jgi:hypothetical protein
MSPKAKVPLIITCPYLGMKHDKSTAYAYPSPRNYCYNCKIPNTPLDSHQEKFCLTAAFNGCPVFTQKNNIPFPQNLAAEQESSQSLAGIWRNLFWIILGLIFIIIIYYFVSNFLITGKLVVHPFLSPQSLRITPTPTRITNTKPFYYTAASVAYSYILLTETSIPSIAFSVSTVTH